MSMYNKIHEVIRQRAVDCGNKKLVKLLDLAKKQKLTVTYAYRKQWERDSIPVPQIEILDEYTYRKYEIRFSIVRTKKGLKINNERIILKNETKEQKTYDLKDFKKLTKRIKELYDFALQVEKINLDELPLMSEFTY